MPAGKPREQARKDIWLNLSDIEQLEGIAIIMNRRGIDTKGRNGKTNYSRVIRWILQNTNPHNIGG